MRNFKSWLISETIKNTKDIKNAIIQSVEFKNPGSWEITNHRAYTQYSPRRFLLQLLGTNIRQPGDTFQLTVLYMYDPDLKQYDTIKGNPHLKFTVDFSGWRPGLNPDNIVHPYGKAIPWYRPDANKPFSGIAGEIVLNTPYEIAVKVEQWIDEFYRDDDDNDDETWEDEPMPENPELVPVPVRDPRR